MGEDDDSTECCNQQLLLLLDEFLIGLFVNLPLFIACLDGDKTDVYAFFKGNINRNVVANNNGIYNGKIPSLLKSEPSMIVVVIAVGA